ncbi:MAG: pyridoxamine 5'-phosphate oxidase family protein [Deltaproteobacteria bacterium]|nr:pyridoxamine 5'-phosphate oxidase family protein [Deltaproteobacteria bacterium]
MTSSTFFHEGQRELQDHFDSRRIADRLEEARRHDDFSDHDRAIITTAPFFFIATITPDGHPDCSFKGGMPGFVRIIGNNVLAFPDYDGNGMFRTLGNIRRNPNVGLLFLQFSENRFRIRINGTATCHLSGPELETFEGAQAVVHVTARDIFPNCPRYIPEMKLENQSEYSPRPNYEPPDPAWKSKPDLAPYLSPKKRK